MRTSPAIRRDGCSGVPRATVRCDGTMLALESCAPAYEESATAIPTPATAIDAEAAEQALWDIKYEGYIARQQVEVNRQQRLASKRIPLQFDYHRLAQMRMEAREKLTRIRPVDLAQASRISGITPADIALLMAHMEGRG